MTRYLMDRVNMLPVCQAKSKQSGQRCKNFAIKNKLVCWLHGGRSTGARTKKGQERQRQAKIKHGFKTKEAIEERRAFRETLHEYKSALDF